MRATVGPLSPGVYWRRRAVVLGAVLLGVIVLFMSCSGEDDSDPKTKNASSQYPTPAPETGSPSPTPSFLDSAGPGAGPALPDPADLLTTDPVDPAEQLLPTTTPPAAAATTAAVPAGGDGGACADAEMSVTPIPTQTTVKRGVPLEIRLKIKNIGTRTCTRDVGAEPQELYLGQGATTIWSSDKCSTATGSDIRAFAPGAEREYQVTWNGKQSTQCANNLPSGPVPPAGDYELRGRLGELISAPASVKIVA
ncbi:adhesin [Actinoplanes sp. OR16]|uniref:adhesin n=1 Tax=Actinoplanes sp. OR16 TaxID=946334 RepID=UPI000FDB2AFF|nr:adhesin [Actinoplanes sp. OR16]